MLLSVSFKMHEILDLTTPKILTFGILIILLKVPWHELSQSWLSSRILEQSHTFPMNYFHCLVNRWIVTSRKIVRISL
jgi:hypothetical protein